nr:polysaccharide deacetylase family protein [Streptomyces sp. NBC_00830]
MARHLFGLSPADVTMSQSGTSLVLEPGSVGTAWDARVGGTQITDLTDLSSNPITEVTSDSYSVIGFYGPDGVTTLYLDFGFSGGRVLMQASDLGASITDLQTNKADLSGATFTGAVTLNANPTAPLGAATKQYSDAAAAAVSLLSGGTVTGNLDVTGRLRSYGFRTPALMPKTRIPPRRYASYAQNLQTGHGWVYSGTGITGNLNDTSTYVTGTQSAQMITGGTAIQSSIRKQNIGTTLDLTGKAIRVTFKVADTSKLDRIMFYVGSSGFANYFNWALHTHSTTSSNMVQSGEWTTLTFSWADVQSAAGTYSITNGVPSTTSGFTDLQFTVFDNSTGPVTVNLQSVEVIPAGPETFPNGVISITFDDSYMSQFDIARPKMDQYGYRGTAYTIAGAVGSNNAVYMDVPRLKSLQNFSGWEIAGHAFSPASHGMPNGFSDLTSDQVHADFTQLKLWLNANGFTGENFAYPKGHFESTIDGAPVDQIAAQYWATSRTIISETKECFPPVMAQRVRSKTGISSLGTSVATIAATGGMLDRCASSGDWLILCLHKLTTGTPADSNEITQTDFNALMDAINVRGIPVMTVNEVISYYT